jgi:DNA replication protein DnaC
MLMNHTLERLKEMRLKGMAECYKSQLEQPDALSLPFEERFSLIIDYEWTNRRNRRLERLLKQAKLRLPACLEDIDYQHPRGLDRSLINRLKSCEWIESFQNIVITGATGVGKTYLACALGNAACRRGYSTRYYRIPRLLSEIAMARGDGSYVKLLNKLRKFRLLIFDDWGLTPFTQDESREILEVIEDRSQLASTIIISQLPVEHWHEVLGDPTLADAILDRIIHNAHKFYLKGESMRKVKGGVSTPVSK